MAATLQWYEGTNTPDGDGRYPGDEAGLTDVERMVGDLTPGRKFTDDEVVGGQLVSGTTPTRTEALTALQRSEDAIISWLVQAGYVEVTPAYATSYPSQFRTLLETRAAQVALRLLSMRPTHERDAFVDETISTSRLDGYAHQVRGVRASILAGTFPLPRTSDSGGAGGSVGAPPVRAASFDFDLGV